MGDESTPAANAAADEPVSPGTDAESEVEIDDDEELAELLAKLREDADDRRTWRWLVLGGAVVLVLFFVGFWPVMAGRLAAAKQLDQAQVLMNRAKGSVDGIDKVVRVQLSPDQAESTPSLDTQILIARRDLKQVVALLDDALPHLTEDEQRRGNLIKTAADARLLMIERAPTILRASVEAVRAKNLADAGWLRSQNADAFESRANAAYPKQTALAVRSAADLYARASGSQLLAKPLYSQAVSAFPGADFSRYVTYADQRVAAVQMARSGAGVWLAGNLAKAKSLRTAYSVKSAKAAQTLKSLPAGPGKVTADAFTRVAGRALDAYEKARTQADEAEKALKNL